MKSSSYLLAVDLALRPRTLLTKDAAFEGTLGGTFLVGASDEGGEGDDDFTSSSSLLLCLEACV